MRKLIIHLLCGLFFLVRLTDGVAAGDDNIPPSDAFAEAAAPAVDTTPAVLLPGQIAVDFSVTPRQEDGRLYFDVTTNLPEGMRFMVAIRDEMGFIYKIGSTMERLETEVVNGGITVGPFPFEDKAFPSGEYLFYMTSYPADSQPEAVIAVIGKNGANLAGPEVVEGMVFFAGTFMITGLN